jgi:nucleotide-binding universal stress UspA family protein
MIKTIVVPTDGSEQADKAVVLAADIAEKYGAGLILLHVLSADPISDDLRRMAEIEHLASPRKGAPFAAVPEGVFPASVVGERQISSSGEGEDHEIRRRIGEEILTRAERTARERGVETLRTVIDEGDPVKQILGHAERDSANLIVMGSRGLSDIKGLLMGSVSHKVSQLSPCSCITVR